MPENENTAAQQLSVPWPLRLWRRLPALLRAILAAELVASIGDLPPAGLMLANLKLHPEIPWLLPATAAWLWAFWRYVNGAGWPRSTAEARRRDLRARPLPARVWRWALLAGGLGIVSVMSFALLNARFADVPRDAFKPPIDVSAIPPWTALSILLAISVTAGVVEEAAYRGYLISPIERRHGWAVAILVSGVMFFVAHLNHSYVTPAFLPFFLAVSALHGLLVYRTRSILPSIVLHSAADFVFLPLQYGWIGHMTTAPVWKTGPDSAFLACLAVTLIFGLAAVPAFRHLAAIVPASDSGPLLPPVPPS